MARGQVGHFLEARSRGTGDARRRGRPQTPEAEHVRGVRGHRSQRSVRYTLESVGETSANSRGVGRHRLGRRREIDLGRSAAQPDGRAGPTRCLSRAGVHQRHVEEVVRRRLSRRDHLDRHAPHHAARTRLGRHSTNAGKTPATPSRQRPATGSSGRVAERPRPPRVPPELCRTPTRGTFDRQRPNRRCLPEPDRPPTQTNRRPLASPPRPALSLACVPHGQPLLHHVQLPAEHLLEPTRRMKPKSVPTPSGEQHGLRQVMSVIHEGSGITTNQTKRDTPKGSE